MSELWAPNLSTSVNSGSLVVWLNANDSNAYELSGSVTITDKDFGANPIIKQINNFGTLGDSLTRLYNADENSPQLMTGSFSSLNGFKFGYTGSAAPGDNNWKETRMSSSIFPNRLSAERQVFLVGSQFFHGADGRSTTNFKTIMSYGKKEVRKIFGISIDGTGNSADRPSMDFFGQQLNASSALFSSADPFGLALIGFSSAGGTNGQERLHFNGTQVAAQTNTLETATDNGLFLGGLPVAGASDVSPSDYILHELLIYNVGAEGDDNAAGFKRIVEGYLAHKWGFSSELPSDHPYKNSAPPAIIFETLESQPALPDIGSDFVINQYRNMSVQRARNVGQIPFSKGLNGPPNIRKRITAYSSSLG